MPKNEKTEEKKTDEAELINVERKKKEENGATTAEKDKKNTEGPVSEREGALDKVQSNAEFKKEEEETEEKPQNLEVNEQFEEGLIKKLKKQGRERPKMVVEPEIGDRETKDIEKTLSKKEEKENVVEKKEEEENKKEDDKIDFENENAQIHFAKSAYIDQFYELSDLFTCCPLYYRYHISFKYKNGEAYHLYDLKENPTATCSHDCCPNQARSISASFQHYLIESGKKKETFRIEKPYRCACSCLCACCTRPTLKVKSKNGDTLGKIIDQNTCSPTLNVYYKHNKKPSYIITGSCSQCGVCCRCLCKGTCTTAEFQILTPDLKKVGLIKKSRQSGHKIKPDSEQISVDFPQDATYLEKKLLLSATIFMSYIYYQYITNGKKCHNV